MSIAPTSIGSGASRRLPATRLVLLALALLVRWVPAEGPSSGTVEGSQDGITRTIEERDTAFSAWLAGRMLPDAMIDRWIEWRKSVLESLRLDLAFTYDSLAMVALGAHHNESGSSGDATLNLKWHLTADTSDRPLALAVRLRDRRAYGEFAPSELRAETGALWGYVDGFSDSGFEVPELYLEPRLFDRKLLMRIGQMSIDDLLDDHPMRSAKRSFMNQAFSSDPAVGFPGYGMGMVGRWKSPAGWDVTLAVSNIESSSLSDEAKWSFESGSLFEGIQAGLTFRGFRERGARFQVLAWHADALPAFQLADGEGVSATLDQELADHAHAYLRCAFSKGEAAPVARLIALGFGQRIHDLDRLGVAVAAGNSSSDPGRWQGVLEVFYRHQSGPVFQVTPDVQVVVGDGLGGWRFVAGLRAELSF